MDDYKVKLDLTDIPNFCAHEHWGSISSIGGSAEGFRADTEQGATPSRRTGLADILIDPYFGGNLGSAGVDLDRATESIDNILPALKRHELTGAYQCLRRGLILLYDTDIYSADAEELRKLEYRISGHYEAMFTWYKQAIIKANLGEVLRPVHPEYYFRRQDNEHAAEEREIIGTLLRIDPLLDMWEYDHPRRDDIAGTTGVDPADAKTWREFIGRLYDTAAEHGCRGIKQFQAYFRSLDYTAREDASVKFRGNLTHDEVRVFQDWIVRECCKQAHERKWPHQFHVGTHNLPNSSPLPLSDLARNYPKMKLVMIHCWPYLDEAGWVAKHNANAYLDTCWLPVLSPEFLRRALETWINYVPYDRIMCSQDSTSVEMAAGASAITRETLSEVISDKTRGFGLSSEDRRAVGKAMLNDNAAAVYGGR